MYIKQLFLGFVSFNSSFDSYRGIILEKNILLFFFLQKKLDLENFRSNFFSKIFFYPLLNFFLKILTPRGVPESKAIQITKKYYSKPKFRSRQEFTGFFVAGLKMAFSPPLIQGEGEVFRFGNSPNLPTTHMPRSKIDQIFY